MEGGPEDAEGHDRGSSQEGADEHGQHRPRPQPPGDPHPPVPGVQPGQKDQPDRDHSEGNPAADPGNAEQLPDVGHMLELPRSEGQAPGFAPVQHGQVELEVRTAAGGVVEDPVDDQEEVVDIKTGLDRRVAGSQAVTVGVLVVGYGLDVCKEQEEGQGQANDQGDRSGRGLTDTSRRPGGSARTIPTRPSSFPRHEATPRRPSVTRSPSVSGAPGP